MFFKNLWDRIFHREQLYQEYAHEVVNELEAKKWVPYPPNTTMGETCLVIAIDDALRANWARYNGQQYKIIADISEFLHLASRSSPRLISEWNDLKARNKDQVIDVVKRASGILS
jgi:hypothetical protein